MSFPISQCPWKVSLHGGHSSRFCDHAHSSLEEILESAVAFGYHTFGVTEHAPRLGDEYLYDEEKELGWTVHTLRQLFEEYAAAVDEAIDAFADRLVILKGFEAEVVPTDSYREIMLAWKTDLKFDYVVGSVHYVDGIIFDYKRSLFEAALEACGGYEGLAVRYYRQVAEMVTSLRPDIVGHFDLIRKNFPAEVDTTSPGIMRAALEALEVIRDCDAIMDVNTASYRKGGTCPYPAPAFIQQAHSLGIPFCFGDDSHDSAQVGAGLIEARTYLLDQGISHITFLSRGLCGLDRTVIPLA